MSVDHKGSASTKEGEWELRDGKFYRRDTVSIAPAPIKKSVSVACQQCPIHIEKIKSLEKTIVELRAQISKMQIEIKNFASIKMKYEATIAELRKKLAGYQGWVSSTVHKTMIQKYEARIKALEGRKPEVVEKVVEKEVIKIEKVPEIQTKIQTQIIERTVLEKPGVQAPPQVAWSYPVVEEVQNVVVQAPVQMVRYEAPVQMVYEQYVPAPVPVVAPIAAVPVPMPAPVHIPAPVYAPPPAPVHHVQQVRTQRVVPQATLIQPAPAQPTYSTVSERSWIVDGPVDKDHVVQTVINPGPSAGGVGHHGVTRLEVGADFKLPAGAREIPNYSSLGGVVPGTHAPYTKIQVPNGTVLGGTVPIRSVGRSRTPATHVQYTAYSGAGIHSAGPMARPVYSAVGESPSITPRITDSMYRVA